MFEIINMFEIGAGFSVGRVAYWHDLRIGKFPDSVDPTRTIDNIVFIDELKGKSIEEYTDEDMQQYIDEYNVGKKPCRQIKTSYTEWHKSQKRYQQGGAIEFASEAVLSYGSKDDVGKLYENPETKERIYEESKELFRKWIEDLKDRFPHLKILYAVAHYDEKTPHLHICYTYRANEYQRGIPCQVCISRALEQDGIAKITDPKTAMEHGGFQQARFYKQFRHEIMNPDLRKLGYTIKQEQHGKMHIDSAVYGQVMQEVDERIEKAKEIEVFKDQIKQLEESEIEPSRSRKDMIVKTIPAKRNQDEMVVIRSSDFYNMETITEIERNRRLIESAKREIEKEHKRISSKLELGADESLRRENEELKSEMMHKDGEILSLKRELSKKQITIENQKLCIKKLLKLIQDTIPRMFEKALQIVKDIFDKEQEIERGR